MWHVLVYNQECKLRECEFSNLPISACSVNFCRNWETIIMPAISLLSVEIHFHPNTNDIQTKFEISWCAYHEATSNEISTFWINHRQTRSETLLTEFFFFTETDSAQYRVTPFLDFPLNYRASVSDQLALAANVHLRKHHGYIWYGNV